RHLDQIPYRGELSVSVPGVVDGWNALLTKYGRITLAQAIEPAIRYARDGYGVPEIIAWQWRDQAEVLARDPNAAKVFLPGGKPPAPGAIFKNPALAATPAQSARRARDAVYRCPTGRGCAAE